MAKTPEPEWKLLEQDGKVEVRRYDAAVAAEVTMTGERYEAINDGFRVLAAYIFGANTIKKKVAMTAPVTQEIILSEKIAMTAPVTQQGGYQKNEWRVRFFMPPGYTLATLPIPNDSRITFVTVPAHRVAVIRFSGFNSDKNLTTHTDDLKAWLVKRKIITSNLPIYAFYDPPWVLPFLRRNEVMIALSD